MLIRDVNASTDEMRVCKHLADAIANAIFNVCERGCGRSLQKKTNFFTGRFLLFNNNNTTKFELHLQSFAHATLLKAGTKFQYILNIIAVAGSADVNAVADA